ncbi:hypothetical protein C8Q80DRAFT_1266188 [Daedaleopsis nitida]|nr:hypothetical protein C8Q80DRAFT_1266188 [Daedaleopsis nitida]
MPHASRTMAVVARAWSVHFSTRANAPLLPTALPFLSVFSASPGLSPVTLTLAPVYRAAMRSPRLALSLDSAGDPHCSFRTSIHHPPASRLSPAVNRPVAQSPASSVLRAIRPKPKAAGTLLNH